MSSSLVVYDDISECNVSSRTEHKYITQPKTYLYSRIIIEFKFLPYLRIY
jgi:hypothetical protein